jgi:hypothetical protein
MAIEKMQGQDGKLEAISYIPSGTNRISALEVGITRLVSVAATEMYTTIDALTGSNATWSGTEEYLFQTTRYRLGTSGRYRALFILSPGILVVTIFSAWLSGVLQARDAGELVAFNPLDPGSALVAGMNRDGARLPIDIALFSEADADILQKSGVLLKYGPVKGSRMGIEAIGNQGIQDDSGVDKAGRPLSAYQD